MTIQFIILTTQRTGSTFLTHLLLSHPQIECYSELFQKNLVNRSKRSKVAKHFEIGYEKYRKKSLTRQINHKFFRTKLINRYLTEIYTSSMDVKAIGFKFMYSQDAMLPEVLQWVKNNNVKVIHNIRVNILKTLVSRKTAQTRGIYSSDKNLPIIKITVDINNLKSDLENIEKKVSYYRNWCQNMESIEITYESLISDRENEIARILEFLDVESFYPLNTDIVKMNSDNLEDIIENYEAVCDTLKGTYYEEFLDQ